MALPNSSRAKKIAAVAGFWLWLGLSLVSLAAMYHLWWTRERVLYVGKSPQEQRVVVLDRAGISSHTLELARSAQACWPPESTYSAHGSEVALSYFKYLVLPRIPSGSPQFGIEETEGQLTLHPAEEITQKTRPTEPSASSPLGLMLSAVVLGVVAAGWRRLGFSFPEGMACAFLALAVAGVASKGVLGSFMPAGITLCIGALLATVLMCRSPAVSPPADASFSPSGLWVRRVCSVVLAASVVWALLMAVAVVPDDWDAWAQWGPKAKILVSPAARLGDVKYFVPGSGDYPLLWPSIWAFSGWCSGGWEEQWSKGWGAICFALTAWQLLGFSTRALGSRTGGWIVAALFASMPVVPLVASWGYAEAPFWLMLVCAMSRLLEWRNFGRRSDLWRAGVFFTAAACTKNEGIVFAALGCVWVLFCGRKFRDLWVVGFPVLMVVGGWRIYASAGMQASSHVVMGLQSSPPEWGAWMARLAEAGSYVARQWVDVKQWNLVLPATLAAAAWLVWTGGRQNRENLLLPIGMLAALFAAVMAHGADWLWQLCVAWNRLTIQFFVVLLPVLAAGFGRWRPRE